MCCKGLVQFIKADEDKNLHASYHEKEEAVQFSESGYDSFQW